VVKFRPPPADVISKPNCTSFIVTSPIQPRFLIQFITASMSTVPEFVVLVRTNEKTWLDPLAPL
jgi:hypothetical protein